MTNNVIAKEFRKILKKVIVTAIYALQKIINI